MWAGVRTWSVGIFGIRAELEKTPKDE